MATTIKTGQTQVDHLNLIIQQKNYMNMPIKFLYKLTDVLN